MGLWLQNIHILTYKYIYNKSNNYGMTGGKFVRKKRIDQILEIPQEVYSDIPKITITGFNELILENYKGILEYEEYFASISTHIGIVNINGFNLNLEKMTNDDIKITGKIESIELESIQDWWRE